MGCQKLTYGKSEPTLKVVWRKSENFAKRDLGGYRHGYNGQERETELNESITSAEFWMYDGRLGRRWNIDPVLLESEGAYVALRNSPLTMTDPDGAYPYDFDYVFGLKFDFGTHIQKIKVYTAVTVNTGLATLSVGINGMYNFKFYDTGKQGFTLLMSAKGGYMSKNRQTNVTFGSNVFKGLGAMSEFSQRTGIVMVNIDEFHISYENDGYPFHLVGLGDGNDRYRTAAVRVGVGDVDLGFNLFTGERLSPSYRRNKEIMSAVKTSNIKNGTNFTLGRFGERYYNGYVIEQGAKYRAGILYLSIGGVQLGVDSDRWIRHPIQDGGAHHAFGPEQPGFQSFSDKFKFNFQFQSIINGTYEPTNDFKTNLNLFNVEFPSLKTSSWKLNPLNSHPIFSNYE